MKWNYFKFCRRYFKIAFREANWRSTFLLAYSFNITLCNSKIIDHILAQH